MEAYYNFYYNNEDKIKDYLKYIGYGGVAFFGGFFIFYLLNFRKNKKAITPTVDSYVKELKVEEIRKILRKLINYVLLRLSQCFDRNGIKILDVLEDIPSEDLETSLSSFIGNNIEIESEKVDEVKKAVDTVVIDPTTFVQSKEDQEKDKKEIERQKMSRKFYIFYFS